MVVTLAASLFLFLALVTGSVALFAPARVGRKAFEERFRELRPSDSNDDARSAATPTLRRSLSSIPTLRRLLSKSAWADTVAVELQQANVHLRVGEYLLMRMLLAMLLVVIPIILLQFHPVGLLIGLVGGLLGYLAPAFYLRLLRRRRIAKIEKQLVEFLPVLASSLRSGFAFQQGIEVAIQQLGPPLTDELSLLLNDVNLGANMQSALLDLGQRVGSTDLDMVITAILVQRTTGGNLAEVLDQAAETMRERERIQGEIQTFTAQQRLTGMILSVYPVAIGLILLAMMPSVYTTLFTETPGQILLGIAFALQVLGFFLIRRALRIDI